MKKLLMIFLSVFIFNISYSTLDSDFKVIESKNTLDIENLKIDINRSSESDMLKSGISKSYVDKIIEYRNITGGFIELKDMIRISGIGKKTYEKLKVKFSEPEKIRLKTFNINFSSDKVLIYYGFSKKEIKKIREFQKKEKIRNNLEMKKFISNKKYEKLKDYIRY